MPILTDIFNPTLNNNQIVAPSKKPLMTQASFYNQKLQQPAVDPNQFKQQLAQNQPQQNTNNIQSSSDDTTNKQYYNDPMSGDYIKAQLSAYANRAAPPSLQPGERVVSANMQLVQPTNFQGYYEQLNSIDQQGQDMLGAAQARSAYALSQKLNSINGQQVQPFKGATLNGNNYGSGVPSNPKANFTYAQQVAPQYGWGPQELSAWYTLGMKESGWNSNAQNPTSTAFGIGQFLNSTWAGTGVAKTSDPQQQVAAMAKYIKNRYGSPSAALAFHIAHNWY